MSDIIHLLPDHIANQIAAGEVIQRPASVVKELVENALDAGATTIQVNIKDAGKTLVQVIDDGKGMSETDARMAFERHATSKISTAAFCFPLADISQHIINASIIKIIFFIVSFDKFCCKDTSFFWNTY